MIETPHLQRASSPLGLGRIFHRTRQIIVAAAGLFAFADSGNAGGVAVGSSTLIQTLDYSDTFTLGISDRIPLSANEFPIGVANPLALTVEDNHGNTSRTWTDVLWSISNDASVINGGMIYPGGSGAGSASGFTQTGGPEVNFGLEYDLRNDFVVQFDAVQVSDRVNISIGNVRDNIYHAGALSVFFRKNNQGTFPEVGIFNSTIGEAITSLDTSLASLDADEWHNYAVRFNLATNELTMWVDQISLGSLDLDTFGGSKVGGGTFAPGAYAALLNANSNNAVSVGATGDDRTWTDNFQVGSAVVPEPGSAAMLMLGMGALGVRRRRR